MRPACTNARDAKAGTHWRWIVCIWIAWTAAWAPTSPAQDTLLTLPENRALEGDIHEYLRAALRLYEHPKGMYKQDLRSPYLSVTIRIPIRAAFSYLVDTVRYSYTVDSLRFGSPRRAKLVRRWSWQDTTHVTPRWILQSPPTEVTTTAYHGELWAVVHDSCQVNIELVKLENLRPLGYATFTLTRKRIR